MTDDLESDNKLLEVSTPDFRAALNTELTLIVHFLLKQGRRILKRALHIFFLGRQYGGTWFGSAFLPQNIALPAVLCIFIFYPILFCIIMFCAVESDISIVFCGLLSFLLFLFGWMNSTVFHFPEENNSAHKKANIFILRWQWWLDLSKELERNGNGIKLPQGARNPSMARHIDDWIILIPATEIQSQPPDIQGKGVGEMKYFVETFFFRFNRNHLRSQVDKWRSRFG